MEEPKRVVIGRNDPYAYASLCRTEFKVRPPRVLRLIPRVP